MNKQKQSRRIEHWHKITVLLVAYDFMAAVLSYFVALWVRYDCRISEINPEFLTTYLRFIPVYALSCVVVFWICKLYRSIWRFASFTELKRTILGTVISAVWHIAGSCLFMWGMTVSRMPISYYVIGMGLQFVLTLGVRFSYRFVLLERGRRAKAGNSERVMLIGAGNAGQSILRDASRRDQERLRFVCAIDDNPNKWGRYIEGVPVVGGRMDIMASVEKYRVDKIFVAIPSASEENKRDILNICKETGCELKNLPDIFHVMSGKVSLGDMRDVAVEDLLGRKPITVDMEQIYSYISGKTILVTGGGGSIGSELCRQVAAHSPKQLIIFDVYENNAYEIEQELREKYPHLNLKVLIGSVRDSRRLLQVFETYKPNIVYHAAAHKHVPLMESSPWESIKNNVIGTYKTAYAAMINRCERFVLISTDKAVNPTNIMGASKRLCEMVIQSFDRAVKEGKAGNLPMLFTHRADKWEITHPAQEIDGFITEFAAVRFGNVLGSNGSVIPLFKKQIAKGGPVTVTHRDIIRYFMTIPEAVSLVMQAGTYAGGGEIFVLDMGAPVKIDELARNLIKLSGLRPDVDIPIVYTGLRPGEKLYEEKLMDEEGMKKTENDLIHIGNPIPFDTEQFLVKLKKLMDAAHNNDENITALVEELVPTYHPAQGGAGKKDATYEKLYRETVGVK